MKLPQTVQEPAVLGSQRLGRPTLQRLLAVELVIAGIKVILR